MSSDLIWNNLVAYSMQIGLLVGLAAFVPAILRLRLPGAKLAYWHILLAACLLLPAVRPWTRAVVSGDVQVTTTVVSVAPAAAKTAREIPTTQIALLLLAAGMVGRLAWLGLGLWRLGRYRRHPCDRGFSGHPSRRAPGDGLRRRPDCARGRVL